MIAKRTEADIKRAVQDWLTLKRFTFYRMNTGMAMLPGRGGKLMPVRFGTPGMADILVILPPRGYALWLEIKREIGPRGGDSHSRQTPDQEAFAQDQAALGAGYRVVRSVDDLERFMFEEVNNAHVIPRTVSKENE